MEVGTLGPALRALRTPVLASFFVRRLVRISNGIVMFGFGSVGLLVFLMTSGGRKGGVREGVKTIESPRGLDTHHFNPALSSEENSLASSWEVVQLSALLKSFRAFSRTGLTLTLQSRTREARPVGCGLVVAFVVATVS